MDRVKHIGQLIDELGRKLLADPSPSDPLPPYVAGLADHRKDVSCSQCPDGLAIKVYLKQMPPFELPQHYKDVHLLYEVSGPFILH
jgi:hypothetical protein